MRFKKMFVVMTVVIGGAALVAGACGGGSSGDHGMNGDMEQPGTAANPDVVIDLKATNLRFVPDAIEVPAGKVVRIDFTNQDKGTEHDFQVDGLKVEMLGGDMSEMHGGDGTMLAAHTTSEGSASVTFRTDQKGTFAIYCTLPGHKDAGMTGTFKVT